MKIFASTLGIALVLTLGACSGENNTAAPGAVSGKSCSTSCATAKACCKENKAATCDTAKTDTASPGAVSGKKDCSGAKSCPATCPMSKNSDKSNG